jgi:hypothetical protein
MEIARERFLDDSRQFHVTLSLRSRTTEAHSALTALSREERDAVALVIARALDDIAKVVAPHVTPEAPSRVNG